MTHVANIGDRGARRRRRSGIAWLALGVLAAVRLIVLDAPREARFALLIPFGLAAFGFLQSKAKT
jgi:hypothetical protein